MASSDSPAISTPPRSIVRPGNKPEGPSGWEEKRIERHVSDTQQAQEAEEERESATGLKGLKEKIHKLGEKMAFVEPKGAQRDEGNQVSC